MSRRIAFEAGGVQVVGMLVVPAEVHAAVSRHAHENAVPPAVVEPNSGSR